MIVFGGYHNVEVQSIFSAETINTGLNESYVQPSFPGWYSASTILSSESS
jgi:hypothetical protein